MFHIRHDASLARSIHHCHTFYAPPFGGISFSYMLLLVRCHQLHATTQQTQREERYIRFSFVFILCHLSLSSIITITYSLSINPSHVDAEAKSNAPSLSPPASATSMRNFYFYLFSSSFFCFNRFYSAHIRFVSALLYFFTRCVPRSCEQFVLVSHVSLSLSLSVAECVWLWCVFGAAARLSILPSRTQALSNSSTVCQLPKETELELIAWIRIASSYLYKSFQSFGTERSIRPFVRSVLSSLARRLMHHAIVYSIRQSSKNRQPTENNEKMKLFFDSSQIANREKEKKRERKQQIRKSSVNGWWVCAHQIRCVNLKLFNQNSTHKQILIFHLCCAAERNRRQNKNTRMHAYARPIRTDSSNSKFSEHRRARLPKVTRLNERVNGRPRQIANSVRAIRFTLIWSALVRKRKGTLVVRPTSNRLRKGATIDAATSPICTAHSSKIAAGKTRETHPLDFFVRKIGLWSLFHPLPSFAELFAHVHADRVRAACAEPTKRRTQSCTHYARECRHGYEVLTWHTILLRFDTQRHHHKQ